MDRVSGSRDVPKLIPLSRWSDFHDWPSVSTLRRWYADNTRNFRDEVTLRAPGAEGDRGRIVIDESAFYAWLKGLDQEVAPSGTDAA